MCAILVILLTSELLAFYCLMEFFKIRSPHTKCFPSCTVLFLRLKLVQSKNGSKHLYGYVKNDAFMFERYGMRITKYPQVINKERKIT